MRVNDGKTQLVCVLSNPILNVSSYIDTGSLGITSQPSLKILGFMIGEDAGMSEISVFFQENSTPSFGG